MSYNEQMDNIVESATNMMDTLTNWVTPLSEGDRQIDDSKLNDQIVDAWVKAETSLNELIEETEMLIALKEDDGEGDPNE